MNGVFFFLPSVYCDARPSFCNPDAKNTVREYFEFVRSDNAGNKREHEWENYRAVRFNYAKYGAVCTSTKYRISYEGCEIDEKENRYGNIYERRDHEKMTPANILVRT